MIASRVTVGGGEVRRVGYHDQQDRHRTGNRGEVSEAMVPCVSSAIWVGL